MSGSTYLPGLALALFAAQVLVAPSDSCCTVCSADENEEWSYRGSRNGPSQWGRLFPKDCNGRSQSPIDIDTNSAKKDKNLPWLALKNYDVPISNATMVNNGHTVQIMPNDTEDMRRTIVHDGVEYHLAQFHFHWGLNSKEGSEHTINDEAYTMEVHFVHLTSDGRGVAVVGVFFEESKDNQGLKPIVDSLKYVMYKHSSTSLKSSLVLNDLLPKNPAPFYRYNGSLTTPNCTQGVIWSVIPEPVHVGKSQMKKFRSLFSVTKEEARKNENRDCLIAPNYRPTQPLNGRDVSLSKKVA